MTQPYPPPGQQHYPQQYPQHYQHYMPQQPPPPPPKAKKWPWFVGGIVVLFVIGSLAQPKTPATTVVAPTVTAVAAPTLAALPAAAIPTSAAPKPVTSVKLPAVKGRNGQIVYDELIGLGLTNLQMASRDAADTVVLLPANWTAVRIEPAAGTTVRSDQTVVVTMTKQ